ncbi:MAG: PEP-CTERM sorting domain-containing protein [Gemmatimonadota bacterium]
MHKLRAMVAVAIALAFARPISAQTHYDFDVLYNGGGNATLAGGSDNPIGTTLTPGDDFFWSIAAQGGSSWYVNTGGDFFPFMAFGVDESGDRLGLFSLTLSLGGIDQYTYSNTEKNQYVHLGTNSISLLSGLNFDRMFLSYLLLDARTSDGIDDPNAAVIGSTLNGLLPIFGAPELNGFSPGIEYREGQGNGDVVPEPATMTLLATGLAGMAAARRRKKLTA